MLKYLHRTSFQTDAIIHLANTFFDLGDIESGNSLLEKAHEIDYGSTHSSLRLAEILFNESPNEALSIAKIAITSLNLKRDSRALARYARFLVRNSQIEEAMQMYQNALTFASEDKAAIHVSLGKLHSQLGQKTEAINAFNIAYELAPETFLTNKVLADFYNAQNYLEEALKYAEKAVQLDSQNHQAHNTLAHILRKLERLEEALVSIEKALKLAPKHGHMTFFKGLVEKELGNYKEALKTLKYSKELGYNRPQVYRNLGMILEELGEIKEAITSLQKAYELTPNDEGLKKHLERLKASI